MYKIDSSVDRPDTAYLFNEVKKMMARGIKTGKLNTLLSQCNQLRDEYKNLIQTKYGIINPNSSAQIIGYLESLSDPNIVEVCAPQGKWTSNKAALQTIAAYGYEVGADIIGYRTAKKYGDGIESMLASQDANGFIHPKVSLTKTNRISYKDPALMNIPKELLWDAVVGSKPGSVLISADIKNQEPSIMINMNNVETLKPALMSENGLYESIFNTIPIYGRLHLVYTNDLPEGIISNKELKEMGVQPIFYTPKPAPIQGMTVGDKEIELIDIINLVIPLGKNPEYPTKTRVLTSDGEVIEVPIRFDIDLSKPSLQKKINQGGIIEVDGVISGIEMSCTGVIRKEFKTAWNAISYGASKLGVKRMCQHMDGEYLYDFISNIPGLSDYRKTCAKLAREGCQEVQTYFGTVLNADQPNKRVLNRVLLDLPIQGTAADILSLLVKHFNEVTTEKGIQDKLFIYYTRHDELIIEATKEIIDTMGIDGVIEFIQDTVSHQVDDWIPFKVEVEQVVKNNEVQTILENDESED